MRNKNYQRSKLNHSRSLMENPFQDGTHMERLVKAKSVDLRGNFIIVDHDNGYSTIVPKNEDKKLN